MFPKFHGIQLALGGSIQNATVENLASDPTPLTGGRIWYNTASKSLKFSSYDGGGAVIVEVVATGASVAAVIADLAALGARVDAIEADYVKKDGSVAFTGNVSLGSNKLTDVANGVDDTDGVNVAQLNSAIGGLANAFEYIGTAAGGNDTAAALDVTTLSKTHPGAYYKVATAGYFKYGAAGTPFFANLNDGLVFNTAAGIDVVDNTNSTVAGTGGEVDVNGSPDTGYVVSLNSTFKGRVSTLETGLAAEITRAEGAESGLSDDIAAEATRATTAEGVLTTAISDETDRATTAEGVLTAAVSGEVTRATAAEGVLQGNIDTVSGALASEVSRATGVEATLSGKIGDLSTLTTTDKDDLVGAINELASGGSAADAKIGDLTTLTTDDKTTVVAAINEVDAHADAAAAAAAAEASRAQGVEGSLASLTTTVKTSLVAAINEVDANADAAASAAAAAQSTADTAASGLAAEITRATGIEGGLRTDVDAATAAVAAETTRATGVEGSLASLTTTAKGSLVAAVNEVNAAVAAEVSRATGAEGTLTTNLAAEVTRATGVEGSLASLATTDKSNLVAAINEVAEAAGEGTGALKDAINAQRYTNVAALAALTHTFTHNLNSEFVQVQTWVKGDDDIFRNDIVAVEETSSNVITVSLTESRIVKVVIQALDQLA